ncbi:response regulator [Shewanella sp. NIFS-20-20]|uniref:response regulator n=1 Tax=Shewanella sp. NIFS-20-20 TaxID=2853806 RepID=UPI001C496CA9|nr:response regulator [Shewanella sp. NIFS-20-20]MBV7317541.1 response regulator [Shewanella sp. NIFS-20-20]
MSQFDISDLTLLLVEPSPLQQKIIIERLHEEGVCNIQTADTITAAKAEAKQCHPDVIACAMHFCDGTALDLVQYVKDDPDICDILLMLVSSESRFEQLDAYKQSGVVAILPKPFSRDNLHTALLSAADLLSHQELELDYLDPHELRVLLVDDSRLSRNIIHRTLHNLGFHHITEACDGCEAKTLFEEQPFDLVVTDYNMPTMDGLSLTRFIREDSEHSHTPILMVTSEADKFNLNQISHSGVDAICDKPFEPKLVRRLLHQILEG